MGFFSNLIGAFTGQAAEDAADAQVAGLDRAIAEQRRVGEEVQADFAPFREGGLKSFEEILNLLGLNGPEAADNALLNFQKSPGFEFRLGEGVNALDRRAGARGKRLSGQQLKGITRFGQDFASNEFSNQFARLSGVAGAGQQATTASANARLGVASNISNSLIDQGSARASGFIGAQNIFGDTFNSLLNAGGRIGAAKILAG